MASVEIMCFNVSGELSAMEPTANGRGRTRRRTGERQGRVVLMIDADLLRKYAEKALMSRGGKCKGMHGGVTFKRVNFIDVSIQSASLSISEGEGAARA